MRQFVAVLIGLAAVTAVGMLDVSTTERASFALLYVVGVGWTAWRGGYVAGLAIAVAASMAWLIADLHGPGSGSLALSLWNGLTRFGLFAAIGISVTKVSNIQRELHATNDLLEERLTAESTFARTDFLTGLKNKRGFIEALETELARANRSGLPFGVLYLDLDRFKGINDEFGHDEGDLVLKKVARLIENTIRSTDVAARLGGDEYGVFCWNIHKRDLQTIADRVVAGVLSLAENYPEVGLGMSVGAVWYGEPPKDVEHILKKADEAMYEAKRNGGNKTAMATGLRSVEQAAVNDAHTPRFGCQNHSTQ